MRRILSKTSRGGGFEVAVTALGCNRPAFRKRPDESLDHGRSPLAGCGWRAYNRTPINTPRPRSRWRRRPPAKRFDRGTGRRQLGDGAGLWVPMATSARVASPPMEFLVRGTAAAVSGCRRFQTKGCQTNTTIGSLAAKVTKAAARLASSVHGHWRARIATQMMGVNSIAVAPCSLVNEAPIP